MATSFQTCMKRELKGKRIKGKTRWRAAFKAAAKRCSHRTRYTKAGVERKKLRRYRRRKAPRRVRRIRRVRRAPRRRRVRRARRARPRRGMATVPVKITCKVR